MGLPAKLKPPADITIKGRKCSGNACGDIGNCTAYVGNLLLNFDYNAMSKILKVTGSLRSRMEKHLSAFRIMGKAI
nr:hypothetical protein [Desulfosporosinus acididurans]